MDITTIELAARMAMEAYSNTPVIAGFVVSPFRSGNIQGFCARKEDDLWIAFCGTNDAQDWLDNLDARKEMVGHGCVHAGFNHALDDVWESVLAAIGQDGWRRISFVGHSMGGALAALAGSRLSRAIIWLDVQIITFGQPRCGDRKWAHDMNLAIPETYLRVFNAGDLVPNLPTCLRFAHAGREIFFDHEGRLASSTIGRRWLSAFHALVTHRRAVLVTLQSHSMSQYLANVMTLEKR